MTFATPSLPLSNLSRNGHRAMLTHWILFLVSVAVGVPVGLFLGVITTRRIRTSRRFRTGALIAAGLFSFMTYRDPGERAAVEETESETNRTDEEEAGDPPDTKGTDPER